MVKSHILNTCNDDEQIGRCTYCPPRPYRNTRVTLTHSDTCRSVCGAGRGDVGRKCPSQSEQNQRAFLEDVPGNGGRVEGTQSDGCWGARKASPARMSRPREGRCGRWTPRADRLAEDTEGGSVRPERGWTGQEGKALQGGWGERGPAQQKAGRRGLGGCPVHHGLSSSLRPPHTRCHRPWVRRWTIPRQASVQGARSPLAQWHIARLIPRDQLRFTLEMQGRFDLRQQSVEYSTVRMKGIKKTHDHLK